MPGTSRGQVGDREQPRLRAQQPREAEEHEDRPPAARAAQLQDRGREHEDVEREAKTARSARSSMSVRVSIMATARSATPDPAGAARRRSSTARKATKV